MIQSDTYKEFLRVYYTINTYCISNIQTLRSKVELYIIYVYKYTQISTSIFSVYLSIITKQSYSIFDHSNLSITIKKKNFVETIVADFFDNNKA